ncbi:Flp family type IVb pilin [Thalassorhabdomicrobium marinisediminis]|uniref:Flp family type IVb pilin n=1 Tax=Thalassorhabdomicrobium marinisediminis TaxID=2170577 RepID=A0A2T7FX61_9RHOB|nr:Flp family type IVb pilin [Thalassorhabdomicrobium marinisediminis]PVA06759.1 Flp family type IVb pilin [Thalassorhabdomicrobium marinisediminis]
MSLCHTWHQTPPVRKDQTRTFTRKALNTFARAVAKDEDGATTIEYGLFAALVGAVIVGTVVTLGDNTEKASRKCTTL